ncbi:MULTISPECIES: BsuPI-related putative proteinase inhibitor [Exiguobacterium]|uniref:BsuPI-related putative proteinase inhibitor n=1 Tax=Exiguobacterium TaxID=33986 RepID=UPI00047EDCBC|nr:MULTISPECIES: BsuPI-related putative proteinase inhibitor [Exiguobacterium]MCK2156756.1 BsuPI-related putative proteinase inhibitor [Exiguobacterium sp. 17-1]
MKWIIRLSCLCVLTLMLAGCNQQEQKKSTTQGDDTEQPIEIKVSGKQLEPNVVLAVVKLKNPNEQALTLTFPTSQRFELKIKDADQKVLYTFSQEQVFTQAIEQERFKGLETKRYEVKIELPASSQPAQVEAMTIRQVKGASASNRKAQSEISN